MGHGGAVVTHSPSTSDPMLESWKLIIDGWQFTVQNLDQLCALVSTAY